MTENFRKALQEVPLRVIQGGMGIGVSSWKLARAVALAGGIGVVSGAAIHLVIARRLQLGDPGGHLKRAFDAFPFTDVAQQVYAKYFIPYGKKKDKPFQNPEMFSLNPSQELNKLVVVANFVEVFLAKEGHSGLIGINYLEKIQIFHIYSLFGAMLAGVDFVTVGAGIPTQFPSIMEKLAKGEAVEYRLDVIGAVTGEFSMRFAPREFFSGQTVPELFQPAFLPIISSNVLANMMAKKLMGQINAFVIEGPTAGGHNAPPRDKNARNEQGEPVYGLKDVVNLAKIRALGVPFIQAGGYGHPEKYEEARQAGAAAIQAGSIFQFSEDSSLAPYLRSIAKAAAFRGTLNIRTSGVSPTGYPFKVALLTGTLSDPIVYSTRKRICDLGLLRELYKKPDGSVGYHCSAEPVEAYVRKGGKAEDCIGKTCLCNCLLANIDLAQHRANGFVEPPLITCGDDVSFAAPPLMRWREDTYRAADALEYIFGKKG
ncbi:MAG: nitronate monooxygenase [Patescibacteria group bacterium]